MSESNVGNAATEALAALQILFNNSQTDSWSGLARGLANLARLPEFDLASGGLVPVPGQEIVQRGIIGFRRSGGKITLAIACGTAMILYLPLDKYIALIERMFERDDEANIIVQNHKAGEEGREEGRGQIMARFNPIHSAFHVVHGVVGKVLKKPTDIARTDIYYLDRTDLACFYLAAKCQIGTEDRLENLIAAYDGWKGYSIPLNPLSVLA